MAADTSFSYDAPWPIYATSWLHQQESSLSFAIGSFQKKYENQVQILRLENGSEKFAVVGEIRHPYPATKIMCCPTQKEHSNILAVSSDNLRLYRTKAEADDQLECELVDDLEKKFAPITSFDWNENDPNVICTANVDGTCIVWAIEHSKPVAEIKRETIFGPFKARIAAIEGTVFDVQFSKDDEKDVFAAACSDGSIRIFDLKDLDTSAIIYEDENKSPVMRIAWNKNRPDLMAALVQNSGDILILDVRQFGKPIIILQGHTYEANGISWSSDPNLLCSCGNHKTVCIWDISSGKSETMTKEPVFWYVAKDAVNQVHWNLKRQKWIAISFSNRLEFLRHEM